MISQYLKYMAQLLAGVPTMHTWRGVPLSKLTTQCLQEQLEVNIELNSEHYLCGWRYLWLNGTLLLCERLKYTKETEEMFPTW